MMQSPQKVWPQGILAAGGEMSWRQIVQVYVLGGGGGGEGLV